MKRTINFTQGNLEALPIPRTGRFEYKDTKISELRLRVTANGQKSYSVYKRLNGGNGKVTRVTLGKFPSLSPTKARIAAQKTLALLAEGINPKQSQRAYSLANIKLRDAYEQYVEAKSLKKNTLNDYKSLMNVQLSSLANKMLKSIKTEEIAGLHKKYSVTSKSRADYAMRLLRAIYNFVNTESLVLDGKSLFSDNPVRIISGRRQWNNVERKQTHIRIAELPRFARTLYQVRSEETITGQSICDAMLFALLTGLRKSEILNLKWDDIYVKSGYFIIHDTKNGLPLELPITNHIQTIFECRGTAFLTKYVFSAENKYGQIRSPRKVVQRVKAESNTDCDFHDLRRTFITTAEHLDIGSYKLKRLINHVSNRSDVTAGYIILTAETLRLSADKVQNIIINRMNSFV